MHKLKIIISLFIILNITFVSFLPSLGNGFIIEWDDLFAVNNRLIKVLTWENVGKIFTSPQQDLYKPLVFLCFALEYHFFKLNPFFYHLINLIFHLVNCALAFWLIFLITKKIGISFVTALLFGIHPLRVESVAWVFQLKDMLYGFFFLWVLVFYLYYRVSHLKRYYYLALSSFALSLLCKPMGLALPLVLLIIDYLKQRSFKLNTYLDKIPFLCLSGGIVIMNLLFNTPNINSEWKRVGLVLLIPYQIIFYLGKTVFPLKLSCLYPNPANLGALYSPSVLLSPMLLLFLTAIVLFSRKYTRKIIFGSTFFLLLLSSVLFSHAYGPYLVADHFTYLALIGIFYMFSEGFFWLYHQKAASSVVIKTTLTLTLCLTTGTLSFLTYQRNKTWKDSLSLWSDVIKNYPNVATAYINRGVFFLSKKEYNLAADDFQKAITLEPKATEPYINLCVLYNGKEEYSRTVALCKKLIATTPPDAKIYINLGLAYNGLGKTQEARTALMKALSLDPEYLDVYYGLAEFYLKNGDTKKALDCYKQVIAKDPYNMGIYNHLVIVQAKLGNHLQIIRLCEKLLEFDPSYAQAYCNLGSAYGSLGDFRASIRYSLQALKLDPSLASAHNNLAVAYYYTQQYSLALEHYDKAIQLGVKVNPEFLKLLEAFRKH